MCEIARHSSNYTERESVWLCCFKRRHTHTHTHTHNAGEFNNLKYSRCHESWPCLKRDDWLLWKNTPRSCAHTRQRWLGMDVLLSYERGGGRRKGGGKRTTKERGGGGGGEKDRDGGKRKDRNRAAKEGKIWKAGHVVWFWFKLSSPLSLRRASLTWADAQFSTDLPLASSSSSPLPHLLSSNPFWPSPLFLSSPLLLLSPVFFSLDLPPLWPPLSFLFGTTCSLALSVFLFESSPVSNVLLFSPRGITIG